MEPNNNIAIAYLRVSTSKQNDEGNSLEVQEKEAMEYASKNNLVLPLLNIYREARPASKIYKYKHEKIMDEIFEERKELKHVLSRATNKEFGHLIVYSRDRLARDSSQANAIEGLLKDNGVTIHYTRAGENILSKDESINDLISSILHSVSELEANIISSRIKGAGKICAQMGYWAGGKPPYGFNTTPVYENKRTKRLKKVPFEEKIVKEIFTYYTYFGYSYKRIAEILSSRYQGKIWTKSSIETIIKNEAYTGSIIWNRRGGRRRPGKHHDEDIVVSDCNEKNIIVTRNEWDNTSALRNKKSEINDPNHLDTLYILKGKLVCGICGEILVTKNRGKDRVYRCPNKSDGIKSELILKKDEIESVFIEHLTDIINFKDIDTLWKNYEQSFIAEINGIEESISNLKSNIADLEVKHDQVKNVLDKDKLQDEVIKNQLIELDVVVQRQINMGLENIQQLNDDLNSFITSKKEFGECFINIIAKFDQLNNPPKRMIIEYLVDRIVVNKTERNKMEIDMIINPPKFIS